MKSWEYDRMLEQICTCYDDQVKDKARDLVKEVYPFHYVNSNTDNEKMFKAFRDNESERMMNRVKTKKGHGIEYLVATMEKIKKIRLNNKY